VEDVPGTNEMEAQATTVTVQDACLLSMLRVCAECDEIPDTIPKLVTEISQFSGRLIRNVSMVSIWMRIGHDLPISGVACS
jgi:hypothetical protein